MAVVGVDGCRGGWFAVRIEGGEKGAWDFDLVKTVTDMVEEKVKKTWKDVSLILIDIPIGLPNPEKRRACDEEAREILKRVGRHPSVFWTSSRAAVDKYRCVHESMTRQQFYDSVSAANGEKLTPPAFAIVPKIAEVDEFIYKRGDNRNPIIREVHPEVCLWALNGKKPMKHGKKNDAGLKERRCVLSKHYPNTINIYNEALKKFPRKKVKKDDIVDAIAAAVTANCCPENLCTLPAGREQRDAEDLPMEMVYCEPSDNGC